MIMNWHYNQTIAFKETAVVTFKIKILRGVLDFKTSLCDCSGTWFQPSKSNF